MNRLKLKGIDHLLWSKPAIVLLSIFIAVFIWLFLVDPVETITFAIPLKTEALTNQNAIENKDLVLITNDLPENVDITVKGRRSFLNKLKKDRYSASLDFADVDSEHVTSINVIGPVYDAKMEPIGVKVVDISPKTIEIQVDKLGDSFVPVEVNRIGNPKLGYKIIEITTKPNIILLIVGNSVRDRAVSALVSVNVSNISESYNSDMFVKIVDSSGREIRGTEKQYKTRINVEVGKVVEVVPDLQGQPPTGYTYKSGTAISSPETVLLKGTTEKLSKVFRIYTKPINISNMSKDTVVNSELIIPDGVKLVDDKEMLVKVTIPVQGLSTKKFEFTKDDVNLFNKSGLYNYTVLTSAIKFTVRGSNHSLNNLNLNTLTLDVGRLVEGEHNVTYNVSLPKDCELVGKSEVKIRVERINIVVP